MLVLSRKLNEEIVIAGNIHVKILEINGNRVRLGIEAPAQVPVLRQELRSLRTNSDNRQLAAEQSDLYSALR